MDVQINDKIDYLNALKGMVEARIMFLAVNDGTDDHTSFDIVPMFGSDRNQNDAFVIIHIDDRAVGETRETVLFWNNLSLDAQRIADRVEGWIIYNGWRHNIHLLDPKG